MLALLSKAIARHARGKEGGCYAVVSHGSVGHLDVVTGPGAGASEGAHAAGGLVRQSLPLRLRGPAEPHLPYPGTRRSALTPAALSRWGVRRRNALPHCPVFRLGDRGPPLRPLHPGPGGDAACGGRAPSVRHLGRGAASGTV